VIIVAGLTAQPPGGAGDADEDASTKTDAAPKTAITLASARDLAPGRAAGAMI
jgi:hypothetical protein